MSALIYFSKVEFQELKRYDFSVRSSILLDVVQRKLSYYVYKYERQMPAITGEKSYAIDGISYGSSQFGKPAKIIKTGKEDFSRRVIPDTNYIQKVAFSYGIQLSEEQMKNLLPYCNASEFEPYRNRKMSMYDEGYIGYRDEIRLRFTGVTDSYIPKMEWFMEYYYDEKHIWPSEKLYQYLVLKYLQGEKQLKGWEPAYGELSLLF